MVSLLKNIGIKYGNESFVKLFYGLGVFGKKLGLSKGPAYTSLTKGQATFFVTIGKSEQI